MDETTLNVQFLEHLGVNENYIDFIDRNGLVDFPVDRLDEIGDYPVFNDIKRLLNYEREHDSNGNKIRQVNSDGDESTYEYDSNGNKIREVNPNGLEYRYEHDSNGNKIRQVNFDGDESTYEYDSNGNKIREVNPNGLEWRYEYEYYASGQLKRIGDIVIPEIR